MKKTLAWLRDYFRRADMLLLFLCIVCAVFGIVVISSAVQTYDNPAKYVVVQTLALGIGIVLYIVMTVIDVDILADKWVFLCVFNVLFLGTLIFFGQESETGNSGWLRFFGIGIQPSEVVKITYIIIMAKHITYLKEYKDLNSVISVAQLAMHFIAIFGLLLFTSKDLGSALVYFFIFAVMLFAGGVKLYWFAIGLAAIAAITPAIWNHFLEDYQKARIIAPYNPDLADPTGYGVTWHATQSKLALASGRLTGTGLGNGTQSQSDAIFAKHSDFIFAVIGEELGMIGCCAVLLLLLLIIIRCVVIGLRSKNTLSMLVCFGVAATVTFQTFENIGMCIGIAPVVGITLPFFSYGGSSLFSMFAAMGLVSGVRYRPKPERFKMYR